MEQSALNFFLARGLNGLARTAGIAEASGMWEAPQGAEQLDSQNSSYRGEARGLKPTALFVPR